MIDEGVNVYDHFREVTKMIGLGSGSQRPIPDFMLTIWLFGSISLGHLA
jgi:hypothetical protein